MPDSSRKHSTTNDNTPSCFTDTNGIITTTTNSLPGYRVTKNLGTIYGITVRSRNWAVDIGGVLRSTVGGELRVFTKLMYTARNEAMDRMVGECMARGGNAVMGLRFDCVAMGVYSEICAYGTAMRVEEMEGGEGGKGVVEVDAEVA